MIGKVPPTELAEHVFSRTGAADDAVIMGPHYGEDAAAIDLGDVTLVVSSDPISLAAERIGTLGVHVACNDVAASGAPPRWLTNVVFLPDGDGSEAMLDTITRQIEEAARSIGVSIVGGHSEYAPERSRPLICLTALGVTDRFIPTGGAEPGDRVVLTKGAGIEGTAILATDFRDDLAGVPDDVIERAAGFFEEISVVPESSVLSAYATGMHDPTEGGTIDGMLEMANASGVRLEIDRDAVPIREETARLCEALGVDPLRIFGSGALLATLPGDAVDPALSELRETGVDAAAIGTVREGDPAVVIDGETITEPVRDDLYALWE